MVAEFKVTQDEITPELQRRIRRMEPANRQRFMTRWGAATRREAQLSARSKGGRRFWREISRSVMLETVRQDAVAVRAYHVAAAQKEFGGRISAPGKGEGAKGAGALAVPIKGSRAEGRTPSEFGDLAFVPRQGRPPLLMLKHWKGIKGTRFEEWNRSEPLFVLVKSVDQAAEPWWPKTRDVARLGERLAMEMVVT